MPIICLLYAYYMHIICLLYACYMPVICSVVSVAVFLNVSKRISGRRKQIFKRTSWVDCEVSAGWQRMNSQEISSVQSWIPATYQKSGFFRQDSGGEGVKGKENTGDISEEWDA